MAELSDYLKLSAEDWARVKPLLDSMAGYMDTLRLAISGERPVDQESLLKGFANVTAGLTAVGQAYSGDTEYVPAVDYTRSPRDDSNPLTHEERLKESNAFYADVLTIGLGLGILTISGDKNPFTSKVIENLDEQAKGKCAFTYIFHSAMNKDKEKTD